MTIKRFSKPLYSCDDQFISCPGTSEIDKMQIDFPETGGVCLKKIGTTKIYDMIQANRSNCDLENVLSACVHANQLVTSSEDDLNNVIADFTGVTNMAELYSTTKRLENIWSDLPLEVRESFDSDIKKFIRGIGSEEFNDKVSDGFNKYSEKIYGNQLVGSVPDVTVPDVTVPDVTVPDVTVPDISNIKVEVK